MLRVRQFFVFTLMLLPLLGGILHTFNDCCLDLDTHTSRIDKHHADKESSDESQKPHFCYGSCASAHFSLITLIPSFKVNRRIAAIVPNFHYSFSQKSNYPPTPSKPPRA